MLFRLTQPDNANISFTTEKCKTTAINVAVSIVPAPASRLWRSVSVFFYFITDRLLPSRRPSHSNWRVEGAWIVIRTKGQCLANTKTAKYFVTVNCKGLPISGIVRNSFLKFTTPKKGLGCFTTFLSCCLSALKYKKASGLMLESWFLLQKNNQRNNSIFMGFTKRNRMPRLDLTNENETVGK